MSALRIQHRISALGLRAIAQHGYHNEDAGILIALHARRSLNAIRSFKQRFPDRPVIVVLTGTDLYTDLPQADPDVIAGFEAADALVVYQQTSIADVPEPFCHKTHVIWKSVDLPIPQHLPAPPASPLTLVMLAHLRATKDPFLAVNALSQLPPNLPITLHHYGSELTDGLAAEARQWSQREPRYHWQPSIPRTQIAATITSCHATINSGRTEGGSNAICESIVLGTPVLATKSPANTGFLGTDYGGFYNIGNASELATLMQRCTTPDSPLLKSLRAQLLTRAPLFESASESAGWKALLDSLT